MKGKPMTLKQAAEFLKTTEYPFTSVTIRRAATGGMLKATKNEGPVPYYTVFEDDLMAWASNPKNHQPGRKTE